MGMMTRVADWLADSREYLEEHGWWRGSERGPNGRQVCAIGAILYSRGYDNQQYQIVRRDVPELVELEDLMEQVFKKNHPCANTIPDWNDNWAVDKQEVLDTFAKAEKIARTGFDPEKGLETL